MPTDPPFWLYFVLFLYGVCFGSFLNACIYRIPQEWSLLTSSRCPKCQARIRFYDNIPLVSYLLLKRRCRSCKAPISSRYFWVELSTGLILAAACWRFGFGWAFAVNAFFLCLILVLMLIDYDHKILPNVITLPGAVIGFLISPAQDSEFYVDSLTLFLAQQFSSPEHQHIALAYFGSGLGILVGGGLLWFVAELYYRVRHVEGLGFGDVKMMAMVGAFLGWKYALLTIFLGSISGSIIGLILMKVQNRDSSYQMPFGTFLGVGTCISVFFGPQILHWYLLSFSNPGSAVSPPASAPLD